MTTWSSPSTSSRRLFRPGTARRSGSTPSYDRRLRRRRDTSTDAADDVELVGDEDELPGLQLAVALSQPALDGRNGKIGVGPQRLFHQPEDAAEEVLLVPGVVSRTGKDHPVGTAEFDDLGPARGEDMIEVTPGGAVAGRSSSRHAVVHRVVVARLNSVFE